MRHLLEAIVKQWTRELRKGNPKAWADLEIAKNYPYDESPVLDALSYLLGEEPPVILELIERSGRQAKRRNHRTHAKRRENETLIAV